MPFLGGKTVYLFSEVSGRLTQDGIPASNRQVFRRVEHNGETVEDRVATDHDGGFVLPAITREDRSLLPREFLARQKIWLKEGAEEILLWETIKRSEEENAELEKLPFELTCELSEPLRFEHLMLHSIETRCRW